MIYGNDTRLLIIGAGGHAKVVIDIARSAGWEPAGCLDPTAFEPCLGVAVLGDDDLAEELFNQGWRVAAVAVGSNALRLRLSARLSEIGYRLPPIVHPSASISTTATVGDATVVMPHATINAQASIGRAVIINTAATIEHDCLVGDGAHIAPGSVLAGNVRVGARVLFGVGSVARPEIQIGDDNIVGAGSVIVSDFPSGPATILGAPGRVVSKDRK